jgi:hypothetical protein
VAQIKIKCPNKDCGKTLIVDSDMAGKKGKCSTCDAVFLIPGTPNPDKPPGGSTIHLATGKSGDLSDETKRGSTSGTRKAPKDSPEKKSSEKFLDDYVEKSGSKKSKPSREGPDDFNVNPADYVDYSDPEDRPRRERPERQERRPASRRDDDYEDYEDYDAPRGRRRRDDYEEDYYEDDYDESYGETVRRGGARSRRKSGPNLGLIRAGFMILAVSGCIYSGALGIKALLSLIIMLTERLGDTSWTIMMIAETLLLVASVAIIVGYSFLLCFPNRNSSLGLTIAALVLASINLIVRIVLRIIPFFSDRGGLMGMGFGGMGDSKIEIILKQLLTEGLFVAELVLVALAMMAINKQLKDRYNVQSAKRMIIPAGIYGGIMIVVSMFTLILMNTKISSMTAVKIWTWVLFLFALAALGMAIWYFVSYTILMFNSRNATPQS